MPGSMQFGAVNNAGVERTELVSTGTVPAGFFTNPTTLLIRNPAPSGQGVLATAFSTGVWGRASSPEDTAVGVEGDGRTGVRGEGRTGVRGRSDGGEVDAGVDGRADGNNSNGVIGEANNGAGAYGIWGKSRDGFAGFVDGKVRVNGQLLLPGMLF